MVRPAATRQRRGRGASPARQVAYEVVRRVTDGAYADRVFSSAAAREQLSPSDRGFAQHLAYGTIQRRRTLDYVVAATSARPIRSIDPPVLDALRMGIFQLLFMGSVPDHAAVTESVELAKSGGGGGHGFANAVLRRASREAADLITQLDPSAVADAAILHSHPEWIARLWWDTLGPDHALALMERDNEPPENAVRLNPLAADPAETLAALERHNVATHAAPGVPDGVVLGDPFDIEGSQLFKTGALTPQSRSSMRVAHALAPQPGERVLDLCAAPGTKTTHVAALMGDEGSVVSVERNEARAESLRAMSERMRATSVEVVVADAREVDGQADFDRVLLDPPCSNLGTLQNRPDARWRKMPEQVEELAGIQGELLDAAAAAVKPGGTLVYSTCTISPRENGERVEALLASRPDFELEGEPVQTLPHLDGSDGFYIATMSRHQ